MSRDGAAGVHQVNWPEERDGGVLRGREMDAIDDGVVLLSMRPRWARVVVSARSRGSGLAGCGRRWFTAVETETGRGKSGMEVRKGQQGMWTVKGRERKGNGSGREKRRRGGVRCEACQDCRADGPEKGRRKASESWSCGCGARNGPCNTSLALIRSGVRLHRLCFNWATLSCSGLKAADFARAPHAVSSDVSPLVICFPPPRALLSGGACASLGKSAPVLVSPTCCCPDSKSLGMYLMYFTPPSPATPCDQLSWSRSVAWRLVAKRWFKAQLNTYRSVGSRHFDFSPILNTEDEKTR